MKRVILAACLLASIGTFAISNSNASAYAMKKGDGQHIPASQVPAPVMADFQMRYPDAKGTQWELENEHGKKVYKADFRRANNRRVRAEWLADGTFLGEK